jgi:hypothetical protein
VLSGTSRGIIAQAGGGTFRPSRSIMLPPMILGHRPADVVEAPQQRGDPAGTVVDEGDP